MRKILPLLTVLFLFRLLPGQVDNIRSGIWQSDNEDGTYTNPVLYADYSDPDVVRVGEYFYMTASSFNCVPGLPILRSRDLVNWELISYAIPASLPPEDVFSIPQHGNGVWAPAIRFHEEEFYIYYGDPDFGIYMLKAKDPMGPWTRPHLVHEAKGWIDPCPLWDDDGRAYLVRAWAGSRSGIKSVLMVHEMTPDGRDLIDEQGVVVFDGHTEDRTVEGPKFYKKDGKYYIFAPAGGVSTGWQLVLQSDNIYGPYAKKTVLHQGITDINGPHQGAWIETRQGESWFIHFQDDEAYGRIVHLQPVTWDNGWPLMGIDGNGDGIGEPVGTFRKPAGTEDYPIMTPPASDEFNNPTLGLQWQWHANPVSNYGYPSGNLGYFRLNAWRLPKDFVNFWQRPNLLLQKFPSPEFTATAKIDFYPLQEGDEAGLIIMGEDYSYLSVEWTAGRRLLAQTTCLEAHRGNEETPTARMNIENSTIYLRVMVSAGGVCNFSYSTDNKEFIPLGNSFQAKPGRWIGARVGLFCTGKTHTNNSGYVNVDWFRFE